MNRLDYMTSRREYPLMQAGRIYQSKENPKHFWITRGASKNRDNAWVAWCHKFKEADRLDNLIDRLRKIDKAKRRSKSGIGKQSSRGRHFLFNYWKIDERWNWVGML